MSSLQEEKEKKKTKVMLVFVVVVVAIVGGFVGVGWINLDRRWEERKGDRKGEEEEGGFLLLSFCLLRLCGGRWSDHHKDDTFFY